MHVYARGYGMYRKYSNTVLYKAIKHSIVESRYSANRYTAVSVITRSARGPRFLHGEI